jgi:hypothetical protein
MVRPSKGRRRDERKFKRLRVKYGPEKPVHLAYGIQVSESGAFLAANRPVFAKGSRIVVEFDTPGGKLVTAAIVRHAKSLPPQLMHISTSGMGVEFISPPKELVEYINGL